MRNTATVTVAAVNCCSSAGAAALQFAALSPGKQLAIKLKICFLAIFSDVKQGDAGSSLNMGSRCEGRFVGKRKPLLGRNTDVKM